ENPKQAFVEYASSRTDKAGGPNTDDDGIDWLDVEEPLDLVDITEESVYESGRNFIRLGRDMHAFVRNMNYAMDFTILENIETNIDPSLPSVVFGRPFVEIAYGLAALSLGGEMLGLGKGCRMKGLLKGDLDLNTAYGAMLGRALENFGLTALKVLAAAVSIGWDLEESETQSSMMGALDVEGKSCSGLVGLS
nr:hypothetical protein [Tanacetum cinerariifolium]